MIQDKKRTAAFIAVYFIFFAALLIIGSFKDFQIEKAVFNPQNSFAEFFMQIYPKYREDYVKACDQFIKTRADFEEKLKNILETKYFKLFQ